MAQVQTITPQTRAPLTVTLASLASAAYREATEVDNSTAQAVDGFLTGKITTGTSPVAGTISIFVSASDGTAARPGNLSGTDAVVTPASEQAQWELARVIPTDATNNHTYEFAIPGLAAIFGGMMPAKFSVIVLNSSGVALNATGGNHEINYTPIKYTWT